MKHLITMTLAASLMACAVATPNTVASPEAPKSEIRVTQNDFAKLSGESWTGSLSYLDYSSGKMSKIPVGLDFEIPTGRKLKYSIIYPGETQYNATEAIKISKDGLSLDGHKVLSRSIDTEGNLLITTRHKGTDDGKTATIKTGYEIADRVFKITKDVKFEDSENYFRRNEYHFER